MRKRAMAAVIAAVLLFAGVAGARAVNGFVYHDADNSAVSLHAQEFEPPDLGVADIDVVLFAPDDYTVTTTEFDGSFNFGGLPAGSYCLHLNVAAAHSCTSRNRAWRLPYAVAEGRVRVVLFGDSYSVVGPHTPYPPRLRDLLDDLAQVEIDNQAVLDTGTADWLPGRTNFADRLLPAVADADVIVFTLGVQDLIDHFGTPPYELGSLLQDMASLWAFYRQLRDNLLAIVDRVHELRPEADLVWVVPPVFSDSQLWLEANGQLLNDLMGMVLDVVFSFLRVDVGKRPYVILADMKGAAPAGEQLDGFLWDAFAFNDAGNQWLAEEVFAALGGVVIGEDDAAVSRNFGFADPALYPAVPLDLGRYGDDDAVDDDDDDDDDDTGGDDDDSVAGDDDASTPAAADGDGDDAAGCGC